MTKENKISESARQREIRLDQQIEQGHQPCPNDLRFLLLRRASRLDEEDLRTFTTRIREMVAQEQAEKQQGLQQTNKRNNF